MALSAAVKTESIKEVGMTGNTSSRLFPVSTSGAELIVPRGRIFEMNKVTTIIDAGECRWIFFYNRDAESKAQCYYSVGYVTRHTQDDAKRKIQF